MPRPDRRAAPPARARREAAPSGAAEPFEFLDIFTRTADGVMAVDPGCLVILWNRAAESILGYAAADVLGRRCHDLVAGRDPAGNLFCHPHCAVITMARREQPAHVYDLTTTAKDGSERRLNVSTVLVPAAGGSIVVHLFRDVTHARRTQAADPGAREERGESGRTAGGLTAREREILRLMARGEGTRTVARRLFISPATVRNHVQNVLAKLGAHSRLEAVAAAFRRGLI
jgi:PAS domain S-box-containing protein